MTHEEEKEKEEEEIDLMMDKLQEDAVEAIEEKREDMQKLYNILGAKKFQFDLKKAFNKLGLLIVKNNHFQKYVYPTSWLNTSLRRN